MSQEVILPQMGESITEGTITQWLKKVGDKVAKEDALFEMSTDKVDAEIPSPYEGILLEIKVQAGQNAQVGAVVAVIGAQAAAVTSDSASLKAHKPSAQTTTQANSTSVKTPQTIAVKDAPKSSPLVRKMASVHDVDLQQIQGSGLGGRITKEDMLQHLQAPKPSVTQPQPIVQLEALPSSSAAAAATVATSLVGPAFTTIPPAYRAQVFEGDKVTPLSGMRQKIAEHMVLSKHVSPHVATVWEMDFHHIAALRQRHKKTWQEQHGVALTYTSFILKAAVDALKDFPDLNASIDGNQVIHHQHVNLGIAVALDWGLIVPVVQAADELNLLGLARRAQDLAQRARQKKLKPQEIASGTFTISNPGQYGPMFNIPVINQPQVAILGVGTVEKRPVVINDDMLGIRHRSYFSLSFDHRLIDGATADLFMKRIKEGLEGFEESQL